MRSIIFIIIFTMTTSVNCYSSELNIKKALFDKKTLNQIDWNKSSRYFKESPTGTEDFKETNVHYDYYGTISLDGINLKLTLATNNEKKNSFIILFLPEYTNDDGVYIDKGEVYRVLDSLKSIYGDDYRYYIHKLSISNDAHFVFDVYQWTVNNTRVTYDVMRFVNSGKEKYSSTSVTYDSTRNVKMIEQVKFLECSIFTYFSDGTNRKSKDLILGIDYNANIVVTDDYFPSVFKIDGDYITGKIENDKGVGTYKISRTSGNLSGGFKSKSGFTATYSGNCVIQSDKKLF